MLIKIRSWFNYHLQAAVDSLSTLGKNPLAAMITIIVIAIALTLPSIFWVFTYNFGQLTKNWQQEGHISLYLKPLLSPEEETAFFKKIQQQPGVGGATFKSRTEGLMELQKQEGMCDIMRYLPENPLPTVIEVIPGVTLHTPLQLQQLYNQLKILPEVDQAKFDREWIARLHGILNFIEIIAKGLIALLGLAVILIVGNTLRMNIQNRQEEIKVLKLIGATDAFILRPFLYAGIWYGLLGAVLAVLFVNIFMLCVGIAAEQLALLYHMHYPVMGLSWQQAYSIVFVAILLSWLGAGLAVKRQLYSIEPFN